MAEYKAKASKGALTFVALIAVVAFLGMVALALGIASNWSYWIPKKYLPTGNGGKDDVTAVAPAANMTIEQTENDGIMLFSAPMALSDFEAYDVSPLADNVQTLTATLTPADTTYQAVDYTAAWKNSTAYWAKTRDVSDYVSLSQAEDGALTCAVAVLQPFNEQIIVTCTARPLTAGDWVPSAQATVDYYRRVNGVVNCELTGYNSYIDDEGEPSRETKYNYYFLARTETIGFYDEVSEIAEFNIIPDTTDGTITTTVTTSASLKIASDMVSTIQGITNRAPVAATITKGNWKTLITQILGSSALNNSTTKRNLYNAFLNKYNAGGCAFVVEVVITDTTLNTTYKQEYNVKFNPLAMGVKASDLALDKDSIIFSLPILTNDYILPEYAA